MNKYVQLVQEVTLLNEGSFVLPRDQIKDLAKVIKTRLSDNKVSEVDIIDIITVLLAITPRNQRVKQFNRFKKSSRS